MPSLAEFACSIAGAAPTALAQAAAEPANAPAPLGLVGWLVVFVVGSAMVVGLASRVRTVHLALGFATTAAMWAVGYISMLAPGLWIGEALFALTLAVPVAFGAIARRAGASAVMTGLVSAFANLLIIGAFLRGDKGASSMVAPLYVAGLFAASTALAWFGGFLARNARPIALPSTAGLFAMVSAITVLILLITGGLVTGLESGLAVPDWPNSFGHNMLLYPISEMKGGIYFEHAHRLFGMLVGTTALVMVSVVFRETRETLPRALAVAFLAMVCVQGLFGGLRVTGNLTSATSGTELAPSTLLAIVHGMFGQIVFVTACVIACVTSDGWRGTVARTGLRGAAALRAMPVALVAVLLVQLFLGASYRHLQIPPTDGQAAQHPAWPVWGHVIGAFVVLSLAVATGALSSSRAREIRPMRILGKGLVHAIGLQFALGIAALVVVLIRETAAIPVYEVLVTSAHQAIGAVILATSAMLAAWSLRAVAAPVDGDAPEVTRSSATTA
jgi:cytochrome c oxidase assembly protein subunit 15